MKKLLIASDTYHPKYDGIVRFLDESIPLLKKKFKITLLIPDFAKTKNVRGIKIIKVPISKRLVIANYNSVEVSKKTKETVEALVKENDIIFSQDLALLGTLSIYYAKKYNKKSVNYLHQIPWSMYSNVITTKKFAKVILNPTILKLGVDLLNKCSDLVVSSKVILDDEGIKKVQTKKTIIPLGIDFNKFKPIRDKEKAKEKIGIKKDVIVIGYAGRISNEKNLLTLLKAFKLLSTEPKDFMLLIVGDGVKEIKEEINKVPNTRITGFVNNIEKYYQAMDIFVLSSFTETSSLVAMEALACGVPVISTPVGNTKIYIKEGINGYFFPIGDYERLYHLLTEVIETNEIKSLSKNTRISIEKYTWERTIKGLINILNK